MEIRPSEVDTVDLIGDLDGEGVQLVRTKGGLYVAVGKLRGKNKGEVLAAGSHPAIVRYNIEKSYSAFQPAMMKSEEASGQEFVTGMSNLLPKQMVDKGFDFYAIKKSNSYDFVLTKQNMEVLKYQAESVDSDIIIGKSDKIITKQLAPVAKAAVRAVATIAAYEEKSVIHGNKRYNPKDLLSGK